MLLLPKKFIFLFHTESLPLFLIKLSSSLTIQSNSFQQWNFKFPRYVIYLKVLINIIAVDLQVYILEVRKSCANLKIDVHRDERQQQLDQIRSVTQSCLTLCNPMNCSTPGLPVHHQLPEFTKTHVHRVSDAIQPSHPLSSPSPPAPNTSQNQSLFQ